jgi:hypothetical protein
MNRTCLREPFNDANDVKLSQRAASVVQKIALTAIVDQADNSTSDPSCVEARAKSSCGQLSHAK